MRYVRSLRALLLFVFLLAACRAQGAVVPPDDDRPAGYDGAWTFRYEKSGSMNVKAWMPKGIHFAESDAPMAKELTATVIEGGTEKTLWVMVDDSDGDGQIDQGDYQELTYRIPYSVSVDVLVGTGWLVSTDSAPTYEWLRYEHPEDARKIEAAWAAAEAEISTGLSYVGLLEDIGADTDAILYTWTGQDYLTRWDPAGGIQPVVGRIRVHGLQQSGDDEADYEEQETSLSFTLAYGAVAPDADTKYGWPTATVSITVRPRDTGGPAGDNGGGSCALGLGGAALSLALFALWRRRA
ncbi:MAG: hypothetical protein IJR14_02890 [Synergistaceae bacterium]|nr:hypothetical protein [Synergistaceae bacterium]